ncbi:isoprenyl transferase [Spirosoma foliorum]|uniref:Isoprenyl transferase n=1 Tax=Spirosoma foliorum TaxID=2710596 RepID=A0A7G5GWP2_9BACT|nr:isoprenyl transferase [Spirosoma foliorum]QMW03284.1 isoprenyl transferase [Spirosoma foliorum]
MKEHIDSGNLPQHIAVIMDGNGRWAKRQGAARVFGHRNAIKAVREVTEGCAELGVKYLTLYAFSTENWNRPKFEVDALMTLLVHTIRGEIKTLMDNNVRLGTIGDTNSLPADCRRELAEAIRETSQNTGLTLLLALSYSGRWDILQATRQLAADVRDGKITPEQIDETLFDQQLATGGIPDPELMIRTSGEMRISNFMLWQLAYAELYMPDVLWPDFRKAHLHEAIVNYQQRERRFGKTSEQLVK